jgi:type IV pilus assembly protein PilW
MMAMSRPHRHQGGFSLLETMIGLLIGMFAVVIVLQVFGTVEANKRSTTGGNDAQINGTVALYGLERDVRQAGYGISAFAILGCQLSYRTSADGAQVTLPSLAPVNINPATSVVPTGDAGTDTVLVIGGTSGNPSEGDAITSTSGSGAYAVSTPSAFTVGDKVVAAASTQASSCALTLDTITAVDTTGSTISVSPGTAGLAAGSAVYDLGPAPVVRAYAIRDGRLTVCNYAAYDCSKTTYANPVNASVWVPVASNIVGLRAQYARDTSGITGATSSMSGVADTYDQLTPGSTSDTSAIPVYCRWARVIGVRLALVGRSQQYDQSVTTTSAPTWAGSSGSPINLSADTDWQHYRYKTLETTVPLRNTIWQGAQTTYQGGAGGC